MKPQYTFRNCTLESADGSPRKFFVGPNVDLIIEKCAYKRIEFQIDPAAKLQITGSTLDGKPLSGLFYRVKNDETGPFGGMTRFRALGLLVCDDRRFEGNRKGRLPVSITRRRTW